MVISPLALHESIALLVKITSAIACDVYYKFADTIKHIHGATVEVVKRSELHQFKVLPMRWIVERSFGWLEKNRRLWRNCERFLHTSLEMTTLAFIALLLKRF